METFAQYSAEIPFEFNVLQFIVSFMISVIVGLIFGVSLSWPIGVGIGGGLLVFQYVFLGKKSSVEVLWLVEKWFVIAVVIEMHSQR